MKICMYVILMLMPISNIIIAENIELSLVSNQVGKDGLVQFKLNSDPKYANQFRIRPITNEGLIEIKTIDGLWVNNAQAWSKMPLIQKEILLRLTNTSNRTMQISFVFQNIKSGILLRSEPIDIYNAAFTNSIIAEINESVTSSKQNTLSYKPASFSNEDTTKIGNYSFDGYGPTLIIVGLVLSLLCIYALYKAINNDKW